MLTIFIVVVFSMFSLTPSEAQPMNLGITRLAPGGPDPIHNPPIQVNLLYKSRNRLIPIPRSFVGTKRENLKGSETFGSLVKPEMGAPAGPHPIHNPNVPFMDRMTMHSLEESKIRIPESPDLFGGNQGDVRNVIGRRLN
ncbi:hypothetical protein TIFTF001_023079 [Ficus carica]|uniref:Uncharacterized protein n=1 Tax=Ficus carica TaxID=3494 RepID=A0AA88DK42_FICCA|nr:hypothetical protein TIFTF001_023079 [Ficus carica]